jgi:hypothetical protein
MQVKMLLQVLSPGVQDSDQAKVTLQILNTELFQALGGGGKQSIIDGMRVAPGERMDRVIQGEDNMKVGDRPFVTT